MRVAYCIALFAMVALASSRKHHHGKELKAAIAKKMLLPKTKGNFESVSLDGRTLKEALQQYIKSEDSKRVSGHPNDEPTPESDSYSEFGPGCTDDYDFIYVPEGKILYLSSPFRRMSRPGKLNTCGWWFWTDDDKAFSFLCGTNLRTRHDYFVVMDPYDGTNLADGAEATFSGSHLAANLVIGLETRKGRTDERTFSCMVSVEQVPPPTPPPTTPSPAA